MFKKRKSGQILVLVLLVVVVALAVGLSAASRNLVNLRSSTQAEQSQRAFTAAEGGVEDVLSKLTDVGDAISDGTPNDTNCIINTGDSSADCGLPTTGSNVSGKVKVVQKRSYETVVGLGDVAQVNLESTPIWSGNLKIDWIKTGDNPISTLEFIFVCQGTSGEVCVSVDTIQENGYGQHREVAKNPDAAYQPSGQTGVGDCTITGTSEGFVCQRTFTIPASGNVKLLRIKPFWNSTTVNVSAITNASAFPVQTYEITSTATTDTGVSRKVAVTRNALLQLPAIFDYVLYSGGDIVK